MNQRWTRHSGNQAHGSGIPVTTKVSAIASGLPVLESHLGYEWHEVAIPLIKNSTDEARLAAFSRYIVAVLRENETFIGADYLRKVATALLHKASDVAWPAFAEASVSEELIDRAIALAGET
jgi:hypothetical protein